MIKSQSYLCHCSKESFGRHERIQQVPEWKVSRGNNAFSSSEGINEVFYYMQLLGLLFFLGGNKVRHLAARFHSLRTICNHSLKGSVSCSRLWGVFYAYIAVCSWVEWSWHWGEGNVCCEKPAAHSQSWEDSGQVHLAKQNELTWGN